MTGRTHDLAAFIALVAAFMIGVVSHVVMDMPTKAGVPLLLPYDHGFGIPPIKALRMESGKFIKKWIVFPSL